MRWPYAFAGLASFVSVIIIPVAINLTDYRQDLVPYGWIAFGVSVAATLLVVILETSAFLIRKKNGN